MLDELIIDLMYPLLNFKTFYLLRTTSKTIKNITEQKHYWKILNFTDKKPLDENTIEEFFPSEYLHVVNVSKKNNAVYSFPKALISKANDIKIIMI
jgi:hypothetical protein